MPTDDPLKDLRAFIETHLSPHIQDSLSISYAPAERLPAAVKLDAFGYRFRLERDSDGTWSLATDEPEPSLLARREGETGFEQWLLLAIAKHTH